MSKRDVIVEPGKPLNVTNSDRDFGTVTVNPGGQIHVETAAQVTIDHLIKN
jgi:predicted amino acid dehydrogenase